MVCKGMRAQLSTSNSDIYSDVSYSLAKKINVNVQNIVYTKTVKEVGVQQTIDITRQLESRVIDCVQEIDALVYDNIVYHLFNNFSTSLF